MMKVSVWLYVGSLMRSLLLFISLFSLCLVAHAQHSFSRMIAFGDSLSDTGNLSSVTIPFPYPYYQNRVSDGPVALDYFAAHIGSSAQASLHLSGTATAYNYSIAGGNIIGDDIEDLQSQLSAYLGRVANTADAQALYTMIIGANDLRDIRSITNSSIADVEIKRIVDQLIAQLTRLTNAGAHYFFISNMPNIGRLPETIAREAMDNGIIQRTSAYSQSYNELLSQRLLEFAQQTGTQIWLFDLDNVLENIISNAAQLGFTQTEVGCFNTDGFDFHSDCLLGSRFDRFVFFDNLHPTNAAHQIVAQAMIEHLTEGSVLGSGASARKVIAGVIMMLLSEE